MAGGAYADWIGRTVETADAAVAGPVARLAATLGRAAPTETVPLLGHWLFHLPDTPQSELGPDGHPVRGGFLPPIPQPRRMWAGGRFRFLQPIRIGAQLIRRSTIVDVADKGAMTFVTVRHTILADGGEAVTEEQDLVYLPVTPPGPAKPVDRPAPESERAIVADEKLMFRFSALTFNAHRIHYDLAYTREVELYPELVVHGPLQAMLLLNLAQDDGLTPAGFSFRGRSPLYAGRAFTACRSGQGLWIRDDAGAVTMTAEVTS